jgi:hypothetical protein
MTLPPRELVQALRRGGVARGIAALALGAYVASRDPVSGADIARAGGAYWIVDALVTASAARLPGALAIGRVVVVLRGSLAVAAGLLMLGLPLDLLFGPWRPGRGLVWIVVVAFTLAAVIVQLGAGGFDLLICREIRRRMPGEWSWALGAALSAALAVAIAAAFAVPVTMLGRVVVAAAFGGGFALLVGAGKLREPRAMPPLPVSPSKP